MCELSGADYLVNIKSDGGRLMIVHFQRITQVFVILGSWQYAVANIRHLRVLQHHRNNRQLPFQRMFEADVGMFSLQLKNTSTGILVCLWGVPLWQLHEDQLVQLAVEVRIGCVHLPDVHPS